MPIKYSKLQKKWYYRLAKVFFWMWTIAMFFVPSFREVCDSTGNSAKDFLLQDSLCHAPSLASWMIDGFVLALGWAVILLVLWRLILYIAGVDRKK